MLSSFLHTLKRDDGSKLVDTVVVTVAPTFIGEGVGVVPEASFKHSCHSIIIFLNLFVIGRGQGPSSAPDCSYRDDGQGLGHGLYGGS